MDDDDWAKYKELNYSMDAMIGQSGFEEAFEEYLHGIDGTRVDVVSRDGAIIKQYYAKSYDENGNVIGEKTPVAGNNVETTLDIKLQQVAEDALAETMRKRTDPQINTATGNNTGLDAQGAAVIVMNPKTGEILACASYPTYNLATMYDDWNTITEDERNPFFNRAFGAEYAPGSTFKMCTLIAAMENRNDNGEYILKYGEEIEGTGVYTRFADQGFKPTCLLYTSSGGATHGWVDGSMAICGSCNIFFYELGYRCTWEMVEETCKALGLGVPTGIELTEKTGYFNDPDRKKQVYGTGVDASFSAGDRVLGGIGQGEHRYTPLQLCVYASTLANNGTRMKATFLNRIISSDYRTLVYENQPTIANQLEMMSTTIETYKEGMKKVITQPEGTGRRYFGGWADQYEDEDGVWPLKDKVTVYAKTGTAQHASGGSDNGAFVCFSHRADETEPDLAIAIFGEKIASVSYLAPVAEKILLAYYELDAAEEVSVFENQIS